MVTRRIFTFRPAKKPTKSCGADADLFVVPEPFVSDLCGEVGTELFEPELGALLLAWRSERRVGADDSALAAAS